MTFPDTGPRQSPSPDDLRSVWEMKAANIRQAWRDFDARETTVTSLPFKGIVELTQNCNFKCVMCSQSWEEKYRRYDSSLNMPLDLFVKIADEVFPTAISIDLRGFGETTVLPYWPDIVDYLDRHPYVEWNLITNLSLNRDDTWDKMMRVNFSVGFSCDGSTKETFEAIRVGGHFDKIRHNLGVISDSIRRRRTGFIYFISTMQRTNMHEMRGLVELAHEFSVPLVGFKIVRGGNGIDLEAEFRSLGDRVGDYAREAVDAALDLGVRVTFNDRVFTQGIDPGKVERVSAWRHGQPAPLTFHGREPKSQEMTSYHERAIDSYRVAANQICFKPFSLALINYRGEIGTCNHMMGPDMLVMGDLRKQSLSEVWNGELYQDFRKQLLFAQPSDPRCRWCFRHRMAD